MTRALVVYAAITAFVALVCLLMVAILLTPGFDDDWSRRARARAARAAVTAWAWPLWLGHFLAHVVHLARDEADDA